MCADSDEGESRRQQLENETLTFAKNIQARAVQKKREKNAELAANEGKLIVFKKTFIVIS